MVAGNLGIASAGAGTTVRVCMGFSLPTIQYPVMALEGIVLVQWGTRYPFPLGNIMANNIVSGASDGLMIILTIMYGYMISCIYT